MKPEELTVEAVERQYGYSTAEWEGQCSRVAAAVVDLLGHASARRVYGHYYGPISHRSIIWGARRHLPFQHHGWVVLGDGRVLDPTRWSFEAKEPYIALLENTGDYDEGGERVRAFMVMPWPEYGASDVGELEPEPAERLLNVKLSNVEVLVLKSLGAKIDRTADGASLLSPIQLGWIACLPRVWLGEHCKSIYRVLIDLGFKALIPLDNYNYIFRRAG